MLGLTYGAYCLTIEFIARRIHNCNQSNSGSVCFTMSDTDEEFFSCSLNESDSSESSNTSKSSNSSESSNSCSSVGSNSPANSKKCSSDGSDSPASSKTRSSDGSNSANSSSDSTESSESSSSNSSDDSDGSGNSSESQNVSDEEKCEVITTNRNGLKLICGGFAFYKDKQVSDIFDNLL